MNISNEQLLHTNKWQAEELGKLKQKLRRASWALEMMPCMLDEIATHPTQEKFKVHSPKCVKCEVLNEISNEKGEG